MTRAADVLFDNDLVHLCGHRGHSIAGTENSKTALRWASSLGATLCEIDIRLTADEQFVVYHDPILDTASEGTGPVRSLRLQELKKIHHKPRFSNGQQDRDKKRDHLTCLEETLEFASALNLGLIVEVKDRLSEAKHVQLLVDIVNNSTLKDFALLSSFDHSFLKDLKADHPTVSTFGIMHTRHISPLRIAKEADLDVYSVDYPRFHPEDAAELQEGGVRVGTFFPRSVVTENGWDTHAGGLSDTLDSAVAGNVNILGMDDVKWGKTFLDKANIPYHDFARANVMA